MPNPVGEFLDGGKPAIEPDSNGGIRNKDTFGPPDKPEFDIIEPSTVRIDSDRGTDEPRRTRDGRIDGRTRAGRAKSSPEKVSKDIKLSLTDVICGLHAMAAQATGIKEFELDEEESQKLGDCITDLSAIYGKTFSPKTAAWINLCGAMGLIYGPRIGAYRMRLEQEAKTKPKPVTGPRVVQNLPANPPPQVKPDQLPTPSQLWQEPAAGL